MPAWAAIPGPDGQKLPQIPGVTAREDPPISWDAYWQQVDEARQSIVELQLIPLSEARLRLEGLALQWEALTAVELPDGQVMTVDHSYLVSLLRDSPPDFVRIEHMLAALLAEKETFVQGQFSEADQNSLSRILAQPEFQWQDQNDDQPNALEKLWRRIQQELSKLGSQLLGLDGIEYIFGFGAVLLLAFGLLFLLRNLLFGFVSEARLAPPAPTGDEHLTADTALKQAQNLSQAGDYRSAVRYLYLSALLLLEERGLLRYDRTKTNGEYLHSVGDQPELATPLRSVVEIFDRVWYGYQPLDDHSFQYYERQVGRLRQHRQPVQPKSDGE
jgi:hypothetical protein